MKKLSQILFPIAAVLCLFPFTSSGVALLGGVLFAVLLDNAYSEYTKKWTHQLLSYSVIGLGAGMNLLVVAQVGMQGIGYTIVGIATSLVLGLLLGKLLKVQEETSLLITIGTAICGGSAIAAVSPVIRAKSDQVSVALGTVFILNAVALFVFPVVGHHFELSQHQFGLWSALAIHDTSSVVGASMQYGAEALSTGTTVKLARALWIVPVSFGIGFIWSRRNPQGAESTAGKAEKPWFILGFLLMAALMTFFPVLQPAGNVIEMVAKRVLVLTLFFIGANLTKQALKQVGIKPFVQGVVLWIVVASCTLGAILAGWIA